MSSAHPHQDQDSAPACPGPDPQPRAPTSFEVPTGAVDTHAHVIGLPPYYPFVAARSYTPPEAKPAKYLEMLDAIGMTYGVLIQVSVHGTDDRLMRETLRANQQRLRGISVLPLGLPASDYDKAASSGVVGLRLNVLYGGGIGYQDLDEFEALARDMNWHLQFLLDVRELPDLAPRLSRLKVPFIIDHMGHFPATLGGQTPGFQTLIGLVRDGGWVKLSGAYRLAEAPPYSETIPLARALAEAAPGRCVWGSDWPHVAHWSSIINVGDLLDTLAMWVPDETLRNRILVDNPQRLYGFRASSDGVNDKVMRS
ncbi:amidohydrolase family protein [Bradyrhizobium erythrophlei]|uniref:Predicted metal-dependent hydrolase, TIM-barrel fold n=1 Tax=Bradyrhizobium erythrophlei TaxID=1437360 RepID=A0A1M5XVZ5_9BRAD|nr:amidohydrolase family protein [Bradyrhizobium erythrophlei]SHI03970.1 Predicted metal-dependent hydrolase, TIM-barrel fold [Bradyrhizobium erythrophlei]